MSSAASRSCGTCACRWKTILSLLAQGASSEEILDDCPKLEADDIRACIAYAHAVIADPAKRSMRRNADDGA